MGQSFSLFGELSIDYYTVVCCVFSWFGVSKIGHSFVGMHRVLNLWLEVLLFSGSKVICAMTLLDNRAFS